MLYCGMDDPTQAASWRRVAVPPVLEAYAGSAGVDAVMLSGSTARGYLFCSRSVRIFISSAASSASVRSVALSAP